MSGVYVGLLAVLAIAYVVTAWALIHARQERCAADHTEGNDDD